MFLRSASMRTRLAGAAVASAGAATLYSSASSEPNRRLRSQPTNTVPVDSITESVYGALINRKVNACPMAVRVAWHAAGTFDERDGSGGSDGATMRFQPEHDDPANAGLFIIHDLLLKVKNEFPRFSFADLWTLAGCKAVEFMGGPRIEFKAGRTDAPEAMAKVPPNGRLPDASQGAAHLREVFGRMGFNDREIVALSGAHTVGRCHKVRSGYDGPWTRNPLRFDNEYFRNLMTLEWKPRRWDGKLQYTDTATETLTMLPTDMALREDPKFRVIAQEYSDNQAAFFRDFAAAFAKLVAKGCPRECQPNLGMPAEGERKAIAAAAEVRELSMHGSLEQMQRVIKENGGPGSVDIDSSDIDSGRTALHKAAFWGHAHVVKFLTRECLCKVGATDFAGDTALHDAARFGHTEIVRILLDVGADVGTTNKAGQTPIALARMHGKDDIEYMIQDHMQKELSNIAAARRESFLLGGAQVPLGRSR